MAWAKKGLAVGYRPYIHGMNGIVEGVRQVRGAAVNQVSDVENVLVTGVPTSALILSQPN